MTLFIKRSDKIGGPFSNDQIKTAVNNGKLRASDEASESRDGPWKPISQTTILDSNNELELELDLEPVENIKSENVIFCRNCGKKGKIDALACLGCGVPPGVGDTFCNHCGVQVAHKEAIMCVKCGGALGKPSFQSQTSSTRNFQSHVTPHEIAEAARSCKKTFGYGPEYYQKKFQEFEDNGGSFKATWNWPAFLVAALFYMYNGLWGKAALLIVVSLLFFPIAWLYAGIAFNYDLYLYKVKGKNFW